VNSRGPFKSLTGRRNLLVQLVANFLAKTVQASYFKGLTGYMGYAQVGLKRNGSLGGSIPVEAPA
jgi:hypothetical protein